MAQIESISGTSMELSRACSVETQTLESSRPERRRNSGVERMASFSDKRSFLGNGEERMEIDKELLEKLAEVKSLANTHPLGAPLDNASR